MIVDKAGKIFDDRRKVNKKVSKERRTEEQQQGPRRDKKTEK